VNLPMLVNVSPRLRDAIVVAENFTASYTPASDRTGFKVCAVELEKLVVAVLSNTVSGSLLDPSPVDAARIDMNPSAKVVRIAAEASAYLTGNAVNLLRHDGIALSDHSTEHCKSVIGRITELRKVVLGAIAREMSDDMRDVMDFSSAALLALADTVAAAAGEANKSVR